MYIGIRMSRGVDCMNISAYNAINLIESRVKSIQKKKKKKTTRITSIPSF